MCVRVWICVRKLIRQPPQLSRPSPSSFCWVTPENVVGMATGREITERDKERERGNEGRTESERRKKRKRGSARERARERERKRNRERDREREVREPADVKVPPITSCFSSAPSFCLSLSVPLFLSLVPTWIPLPALHSTVTSAFRSAITTEMRQSGPTHAHTLDAQHTHTHTHKCHCKLKVAAHSHTHMHERSDTQQWPLSECSSRGIMTAFCSNHSWDSSHRRDRQRERKTISLCLHLSSYSPPPLQQPWLCPEHVTLQRSTLLTGKVWTDESFNAIGDYGHIKEIFLQKKPLSTKSFSLESWLQKLWLILLEISPTIPWA